MSVFSNPFFSFAGQLERQRAAGTAILTTIQKAADFLPFVPTPKDKVVAVNPDSQLGKLGAAVAAHPLTSAAVVSAALPTAGAAAIRSAAVTAARGAPLGVKVASVPAAIFTAGIVGKAPGKVAEASLSLPGKVSDLGADVGQFIADPSLQNAKKIITENKAVLITSGVVAAALAAPVAISASSAFTASKQAAASSALGSAISDVAKAATAAPAIPAGFGKGDSNGKIPLESSAEIIPRSPTGATVPVATAAKAAQTTKKYKKKNNGGRLDVHLKVPGFNSGRGRSAYRRNIRLGLAYAQKEQFLKAA